MANLFVMKEYRFYGSHLFFVFLWFCIILFASYKLCVSYTLFSSHPNCMQVILFAVAFIAIGGSGQQVRAKVLTTSQGHHSKSKVCTDKNALSHSVLTVQFYLRELFIFSASEKGLKFCKLTKFRRVGGSWRRPGRVPGAGLVQPVVDPELHQPRASSAASAE